MSKIKKWWNIGFYIMNPSWLNKDGMKMVSYFQFGLLWSFTLVFRIVLVFSFITYRSINLWLSFIGKGLDVWVQSNFELVKKSWLFQTY